MAQFTVRNLEEEVKLRLKHRAGLHGTSLEEEVRNILRNAVKPGPRARAGLGSRIASRFAREGLAADLPELRGQPARSARFDT